MRNFWVLEHVVLSFQTLWQSVAIDPFMTGMEKFCPTAKLTQTQNFAAAANTSPPPTNTPNDTTKAFPSLSFHVMLSHFMQR
jgi:hypothetical protein